MNNEIKIALNVVLEPKKLLKVLTIKTLDNGVPVEITQPVYSKGVFQNIYMPIDTYKDMIKSRPFWSKEREWKHLNKKQRIEMHMQRISDSLHGHSYSFEILT